MELTKKNKDHIDALSVRSLLERWRIPLISCDPWLEGETGDYWLERIGKVRNKPGGDATWTAASKSTGYPKS